MDYDFSHLYGLLLAVLTATLSLRYFSNFKLLQHFYLKRLKYVQIFAPSFSTWTSISRLELITVLLFLGVNSVLIVLPPGQFHSKLPRFALLNGSLLFLSGRTNPIVDKFNISLHIYYVVHHCLGRVSSAQAVVHSVTAWSSATLHQRISGLVLSLLMAVICLTSIWVFRRWHLSFLAVHRVLSLAIMGSLGWHIHTVSRSKTSLAWIIYYFILALWSASLLIRIRKRIQRYNIIDLDVKGDTPLYDDVLVKVKPTRAVTGDLDRARRGAYFYVYVPGLPLRYRYFSRMAPVVWWNWGPRSSHEPGQFSLFLDRRWAAGLRQNDQIILDGPYGEDCRSRQYRKVVLVADGLSICGVLSYALSFFERLRNDNININKKVTLGLHHDQTRYLTIIWKIESNKQYKQVSPMVEELRYFLEAKNRLNLYLFYPESHKRPIVNHIDEEKRRNAEYKRKPGADLPYELRSYSKEKDILPALHESVEKAGQVLVLSCATPSFAAKIRKEVVDLVGKDVKKDIYYHEVEYQSRKGW